MHSFAYHWLKKSQISFCLRMGGSRRKIPTDDLNTILPQGFRDSPHRFGQALSQDLLDLDLGPNGKILLYVDGLLICSLDEKNTQQDAIQVLNFLAERGYKISHAKAKTVETKGHLPGSSDYTQVQEAVL